MKRERGACHVAKVVRKHQGKVYTSYLLRRSFRQAGKVKHKTLANLSHLPENVIDLIRRSLQGETFVPAEQAAFRVVGSLPHGHVEAVLTMIRKLGLERILAARPARQRDLVVALIVQHVIHPCSKLATTRLWSTTTLAEQLAVEDATENELYAAMDWLDGRRAAIEKKLAERHLSEGCLALYDVSSSYYEGKTCPLARHGHSRDGKKGKPIIVYGVLTDSDGRPVGLDVYPGNTADPVTVADQVEKLRGRFGLKRVLLVGDRGMLTEVQIDLLRKYPGLGWISALRSYAIRKLLDTGQVDPSLFDTRNLAEIRSPDFPGERLIVGYNPLLAEERRRKRQRLLAATEKTLELLARVVARRSKKPLSAVQIGLKTGKRVKRFKRAKHFRLEIDDGRFLWSRKNESIEREEQLDGIYVIRTSATQRTLSAENTVRGYKRLTLLEQGFRRLKLEIKVRPIRHRVPPRVQVHLFICLLAQYVLWHLREAWRPLLFADEELIQDRQTRDPVLPAEPSESVKQKKQTKTTTSGLPAHSLETLLAELSCRCRCRCAVAGAVGSSFDQITDPTPLQAEALRLLDL